MEYKNCEEYVLAKLQELEDENEQLRMFIVDLTELLISKGIASPIEFNEKLVSWLWNVHVKIVKKEKLDVIVIAIII